jgi:hypothetical protein
LPRKKTTYEQARGKRIRSYGLTLPEFDALMEEQKGLCWICGENNGVMALCIDHDHVTNNVRGLLCNLCNRALGLFKDNPDLIKKAAEYLEKGVPTHLQGKLIGKHGKKIRVPFDYVETSSLINRSLEHPFAELIKALHETEQLA